MGDDEERSTGHEAVERSMDWKKMLAYVSGSVDEELLLRNEYLIKENLIRMAADVFDEKLR